MKRPVVFQGLFLNDFSRMAGLRLFGTQELYCCFLRPWEHVTIDIFEKFKPSAPGIMPQQFAHGCIWFTLAGQELCSKTLKTLGENAAGERKKSAFGFLCDFWILLGATSYLLTQRMRATRSPYRTWLQARGVMDPSRNVSTISCLPAWFFYLGVWMTRKRYRNNTFWKGSCHGWFINRFSKDLISWISPGKHL